MNDYSNISFEQDKSIGIVYINRPKALNALNHAVLTELSSLFDKISADRTVKVLIITGTGDKAFAAGADIAGMQQMTALEGRSWGQLGQAVFRKLEELPQPVIAAVNGFALGGGCELAMACDMRIASNKARFGQPEVTLGICPGFGGTQRLARLVGRGRAMELLLTGGMADAAEAMRIGLVNRVVAPEDLISEARKLAEQIITKAPVAVSLCKAAVNRGLEMDLAEGIAYEAEVFGLCFSTADQKEGMSAFLAKRKPEFTGR